MDFFRMVDEEWHLFGPDFFPAKGGLVIGRVVVDFYSSHEAFMESLLFCFTFGRDKDATTAHVYRFLNR